MNYFDRICLLSLLAAPLAACQSAGYMSSVALTGAESRQHVVEAISEGVTEQGMARDEFASAGRMLASIQTASEVAAAELYSEYLDQIDLCARRVERFDDQIEVLQIGADQLFVDWEAELEQFTSEAIREQSSHRLEAARSGFALLHDELTGVHGQMVASLFTHKDYALYFNHNLAGSSRELLGSENRRFRATMATMSKDCNVVEADARTFNERLSGSPEVAPEPSGVPTPDAPESKQ
ncbi:MAG: DUF2959 family protein [Planctomycetota bacterium]|nr:DUF2959 family protein [Planctomycetota bacterium]